MKRNLILVADTNKQQLEFFENILGNSHYDVRYVSTSLEAATLCKSLWFSHVFIGDMSDITWMVRHDGMTILYSMNPAMIESYKHLLNVYEIVPFLSMRNYLINNGFTASPSQKISHSDFINLDID